VVGEKEMKTKNTSKIDPKIFIITKLTGATIKNEKVSCQDKLSMMTREPTNMIVLRKKTFIFRAKVSAKVWQSAVRRLVISPVSEKFFRKLETNRINNDRIEERFQFKKSQIDSLYPFL